MDEANRTMIVDVLFPPAQAATYGGLGATLASMALSLPQWASVVSLLVTVGGFLLQVYVQVHRLRREALEDAERRRERTTRMEAHGP